MASESQVVELSFVAPSTMTPRKGLWVSSMDLERANAGHTPIVYLYRRFSDHSADSFFDPTSLKESLAKALVPFYPLAGRVGVDGDGRTEINCNSEGALFVVVRSELTVQDLKPSPELRKLFVPRIEPSSVILAVQMTFLKCGGVVLGTAIHHVAVDGISAFHFMQTWSAISRDGNGAAVELPCHDRTLLRARSPPAVHPDALSVLYFHKMASKLETEPSRPPTTAGAFIVSKEQLASLKRICGGASTFCAMTALIWQCSCAARRLPPDAQACVSFSANVRRRGMSVVPERYFGNALVTLYASGVARDIASEPLEHVAGRISAPIKRLDHELVRSAIDQFKLLDIDYRLQTRAFLPETELRVVSWLGMPAYEADFGWGNPWRMSRAESARPGNVHLVMDGPGADSGIRVLACMETANLNEFERLLYAKL